jgi:hypothetical protein
MSPEKIIPKKTAMVPKKTAIVPKKSTIPKKITVEKKSAPAKPVENLEGKTPEQINVAGFKQKIANAAITPKILRPKSETWDKKLQNKEKRKKGLVIFVYAMPKVGKTHFALTASNLEEVQGQNRTIPRGYPVYVLDTENSVSDEAEVKFSNDLNANKIIIENCFVENDVTKEVDPTKSLDKMEEWAYSLQDEEDGTLIVDSFTDYCEYAYYKLVDRVLKIGFTEDGAEQKAPMPIQYKWRTKKVVSFLRTLRNFNINVILTAQGKEETVSTGSGPMDYSKTGKVIADALDKSSFWVDVICILDKEIDDDGNISRKLVVTDCRFETATMKAGEYVLQNDEITIPNLIKLFKGLL